MSSSVVVGGAVSIRARAQSILKMLVLDTPILRQQIHFWKTMLGNMHVKRTAQFWGKNPEQSNLGKQESPRGRRPHRPWATPPGFCDESLAPPWATPPAARSKFHYGHRPAPPDADGVHVRRCEALGRSSSPPPPSWEFCSKVELTNNARESALQTYDLRLLPNQKTVILFVGCCFSDFFKIDLCRILIAKLIF